MAFLDKNIIRTLRETVRDNQFLSHEDEYQPHINLLYAIMDRMDSCVNYLNSHTKHPKKEMDFLFFFMTCCTINDAVQQFFEAVSRTSPKASRSTHSSDDTHHFFRETCERNNIRNVKGNKVGEIPTDEMFFKYIRSLIFAHPFETNKSSVIPDNTRQFSPYVLIDTSYFLDAQKDEIAIRVYSDDPKQEKYIRIAFNAIKVYIKYKYEQISKIIEWIECQKSIVHNRWKQRMVNRNLSIDEMLLDAREICKERHVEYLGDIEDLYTFLTYRLTDIKRNIESVGIYRKAIIDAIPQICDAVDTLDTDALYTIPEQLLFPRDIQSSFGNFDYFVSKISIADDDVFFKIAAEIFTKETKSWGWVKIDIDKMDTEEIRLLVSASCYLQMQQELCSKESK